jgi:hypothetical protein
MTCFYAFMAAAKSSENSLNDNNDEPISTRKHIYIYYQVHVKINVAMPLFAHDWVFSKRFGCLML